MKSIYNNSANNPSAPKWSAFAVVALATTMQAMDFSFINLSYPILTKTFNSQLATVVWLNLIFSLIVISFGPFFGKLSDIAGRKKIFIIGSGLMTLGFFTCAVSQNIGQLIFFRILYSIGSAIITTCFAAIITDVFPENELGKGMGLWNASLSLGFMVAPFLAGILLNYFSWRAIFYVRIPFGILVFIMALFLIKKDKSADSDTKLDFIGAIISSAGFLSLIIGINLISKFGIESGIVSFLIATGIVLIALFVYTETKVKNPIVDLSLFRNIPFSTGMITIFLFWCAAQGSVVTFPFYLTESLGWPVTGMGILFTITPVIMIIISPISGSLSDRIGSIPLMIISLLLSVICFFILWTYDLHTGLVIIVIVQIIFGMVTGIFQPANNSLIMGAVQPEKRGMASALSASVLHFGLALGMGWAGMYYSLRLVFHKEKLIAEGIETALSAGRSVNLAFHDVVVIATFIQILNLIISIIPELKGRKNIKNR